MVPVPDWLVLMSSWTNSATIGIYVTLNIIHSNIAAILTVGARQISGRDAPLLVTKAF